MYTVLLLIKGNESESVDILRLRFRLKWYDFATLPTQFYTLYYCCIYIEKKSNNKRGSVLGSYYQIMLQWLPKI